MRIEDTDRSREVAGAEENIIQTLKDFKLDFDEGPVKQSQRLPIYKKYADELIAKGAAYKCYCSAERIEQLKAEAAASKIPFKYDKKCLTSPQPSPESERGQYVVRQNIPEEGSVEFEDLVHGKIKVENRTLDDGILLKSDGYPVYNFANVIDDHEMGITHAIRGEEFIPSTPKHILLYRAFGWSVPRFAHLPLLLDKNRKKLSKRFGDVAVREYVEKGYLKEALLNFVALLGWNPKTTREIFSLEELVSEFSLTKVNRAGAVFDIEKLDFINRQWQKKLDLGEKDPMFQRTKRLLEEKFGNLTLEGVWPLILERVKGPSELETRLPEFHFFFEEPEYEAGLLIWKDTKSQEIKEALRKSLELISNLPALPADRQFPISKQDAENRFFEVIGDSDKGLFLWPLRVAFSGLRNSPGPFEIMEILDKDTALRRIQAAIEKL